MMRLGPWTIYGPSDSSGSYVDPAEGGDARYPAGAEHFRFFPPKTRTYQVRFQYGLNVDAVSASAAYSKVAALIKHEPSLALRGCETLKRRSLWKMLLLGV